MPSEYDKEKILRGDFKAFRGSLLRHWIALVAGTPIFILAGIGSLTGLQLPPWLVWPVVGGLCVAYSCFLAFRDERRRSETEIHSEKEASRMLLADAQRAVEASNAELDAIKAEWRRLKEHPLEITLASDVKGLLVTRVVNQAITSVAIHHVTLPLIERSGKQSRLERRGQGSATMPCILDPGRRMEVRFKISKGGLLAYGIKECWARVELENGTVMESDRFIPQEPQGEKA